MKHFQNDSTEILQYSDLNKTTNSNRVLKSVVKITQVKRIILYHLLRENN
jgi:hypothetical protein